MNRTKWMAGILTSAAVVLAGLGVGATTAGAAPKVDPLLPTELTLPFMGAPLKLTVTTGPGGAITSADLDNAGAFTATEVDARKVRFVANDGTLQLTVKSKGNEQRVTAKAAEFSQLVGSSNWSGDVFGTGAASTVAFTVGGDELAPTLTIDSAVSGDAAAGGEAIIGDIRTESEDDGEIEVKGSVQFTLDGQSRTLSIKLETGEDDDDDDSPEGASLRITLSKLRGVPQSIEDAVGQKTWTAALCDGVNTATVVYTVNADGTLTLDSATNSDGSSPEIKTDDDKIEVRFGKDARVKFRSDIDGDQITVRIDEKVRCRGAADPTTNVSTSTTIDDDDDDDDDDDEHHGRGGDDDDDDDDHGRDHDEDD
jgi:hypothetical protein